MKHLKRLWCLAFWCRFEKSSVTKVAKYRWDMMCLRCEHHYTVDLR